ncbi:uncharacterized protein LOC124552538 isoform X2 [Schistocerca americana]|uniref:uncharacterized protein LOC124552538 isoform X2 n=1 Tax=Schistocerca americana TaxID=7009 RepID=UPI001F4FAE50|nr:uncharacterized protein LOC124552538 isoform X2 [Schistocerca americana]
MENKSEPVGIAALGKGETDGSQNRAVGNGESSDHQKERKTDEPKPQTSDESCRKRKVKLESSEKVHKRKRMLVQRLKLRSLRKKNEAARRSAQQYGPSLTDLSDELLLVVLRSLPPRDVRSLGQVSSRFVNVVADHTLWVSPDFRHQRGLSCDQFCEQYLPFLGPWTTSVATRGPLLSPEPARLLPRVGDYLSAEFVARLEARCPNLKALVLRDHRIDAREVCPGTLPRRLERLSFRRCGLVGTQPGDSYFSGFHTALAHLQELELNRCPWFYSHSLMALSKCAHLKVLRITQCPGIVDSLPYISLSCRFGFKSLEVLDLRQTPVGDPEVMCFSQLQRLEELLLERPGAVASAVADSSDSSDGSDAELLPCTAGASAAGRWPVPRCRCGESPPEWGGGSGAGRPCYGGANCGCWGTGGRCSPPPDDVDHHQHAHSSWHHEVGHTLQGRHPGVNCVDWSPSLMESVSDTGICSLGKGTRSAPGVVVVRMVGIALTEHNPRLRKLVVRGFSYVTDASVRYLALVNTLRHLDLAGCGVTRRGLEAFAALRPDVEVVGLQRKRTEWEEYRDRIEGSLADKAARDVAIPENTRSAGHSKTSQRTG